MVSKGKEEGGGKAYVVPEALQMKSEWYRITLTEQMFGTVAKDPTSFDYAVIQKAAAQSLSEELSNEEITAAGLVLNEKGEVVAPDTDEPPQRGETGFYHDDDGLFLLDYQMRGFIREAGNTLSDQLGIPLLRSKLTNFAFVKPRRIRITTKQGEVLRAADGQNVRPIRTMTAKGPRVAIIRSDSINEGRIMEFEVTILKNSFKITHEVIHRVLDYGQFQGLLQFRTGGYGRFEWERIK